MKDYSDAYTRYIQGVRANNEAVKSNLELDIRRAREDRMRLKDFYQQKRLEALSRKDEAQARYLEASADSVDTLTDAQVQAALALARQRNASAGAADALAEQRRANTGGTTEEEYEYKNINGKIVRVKKTSRKRSSGSGNRSGGSSLLPGNGNNGGGGSLLP